MSALEHQKYQHLIRTDNTYATYANAEKALAKAVGELGDWSGPGDQIRYLIAATPDGRFAPVVLGAQHSWLCHNNVTVIG